MIFLFSQIRVKLVLQDPPVVKDHLVFKECPVNAVLVAFLVLRVTE